MAPDFGCPESTVMCMCMHTYVRTRYMQLYRYTRPTHVNVCGTINHARTSSHPGSGLTYLPTHSPPGGSHDPEGGASATPRLGEGGWTPTRPAREPLRKSPDDKQGFESTLGS